MTRLLPMEKRVTGVNANSSYSTTIRGAKTHYIAETKDKGIVEGRLLIAFSFCEEKANKLNGFEKVKKTAGRSALDFARMEII
ncbi:CFF_collapsed_G0044810.mRNA.1.CDS.1 [Saccharomyces cerevisiae]|nr:CFF_collapsed_G0044810.mRNA.1.CDS.1 [Saccharomyces cerevisiae]